MFFANNAMAESEAILETPKLAFSSVIGEATRQAERTPGPEAVKALRGLVEEWHDRVMGGETDLNGHIGMMTGLAREQHALGDHEGMTRTIEVMRLALERLQTPYDRVEGQIFLVNTISPLHDEPVMIEELATLKDLAEALPRKVSDGGFRKGTDFYSLAYARIVNQEFMSGRLNAAERTLSAMRVESEEERAFVKAWRERIARVRANVLAEAGH